MAETGESYQQALARVRAQPQTSPPHAPRDVDLLCIDYFGTELTLATFQIVEHLACVFVPSSRFAGASGSNAGQRSPLLALGGRRIVH